MTVYLLFSAPSNGYDESKHFQEIFWKRPTLQVLREYFTSHKTKTSEVLDYDFLKIIKGHKVDVYGEQYWLEPFTKPIKQSQDEQADNSHHPHGDALHDLESAAEGV